MLDMYSGTSFLCWTGIQVHRFYVGQVFRYIIFMLDRYSGT